MTLCVQCRIRSDQNKGGALLEFSMRAAMQYLFGIIQTTHLEEDRRDQLWPVMGLTENYIQNVTVSHVTLFLLNCSSFSKQL